MLQVQTQTNKNNEFNQRLSKYFFKKLTLINKNYTKTQNFVEYNEAIRKLFKLKKIHKITLYSLYYLGLGGFLEGEGSLNVSAKKNTTSKFKVYFDPEFNLTQSIYGISNLYLALCVFQSGRIRFKSGSKATFVFIIDNRDLLEKKVIPFYKTYVHPYGCEFKKNKTVLFEELLILFRTGKQYKLEGMINEIIPRWDAMRVQLGQKNQTFKSQLDAISYIKVNTNSK